MAKIMTLHQICALLGCTATMLWATSSLAQDTSVPESVRLMIQQSQGMSQFEQMARMQVDVQFREFLNALQGDTRHKAQVESAIIEVLTERAQLSNAVASGQGNAAELATASDYAYLRARLVPLLSPAELARLDNRRGGPSNAQLKQQYAEELARIAPTLTPANSELVLDTVVKHLQVGNSTAAPLGQMSVDELVGQQMQAFMQAKNELQSLLSGPQLQEANNFLNQLQSNLYRNRSMSEATR